MMDEPTTLAALLALTMALVKVVERLIDVGMEKIKARRPRAASGVTVVQLDADTTHIIREIAQKSSDMHAILHVRDNDGAPLVYSSRSALSDVSDVLKEVVEAQREVVDAQKNLAHTQERIIDRLETVEEKLDRGVRVRGVSRAERP